MQRYNNYSNLTNKVINLFIITHHYQGGIVFSKIKTGYRKNNF